MMRRHTATGVKTMAFICPATSLPWVLSLLEREHFFYYVTYLLDNLKYTFHYCQEMQSVVILGC